MSIFIRLIFNYSVATGSAPNITFACPLQSVPNVITDAGFSTVIVTSEVALPNALIPIDVTFDGIYISFK